MLQFFKASLLLNMELYLIYILFFKKYARLDPITTWLGEY